MPCVSGANLVCTVPRVGPDYFIIYIDYKKINIYITLTLTHKYIFFS